MLWQSEVMASIPRFIAGTAVVLAAVLTTAPLTAGIADYVLNPGQQPNKRAAIQAFTGTRVPAPDTTATREAPAAQRSSESATEPNSAPLTSLEDADSRVEALAADLQIGVDNGELSQSDASRVLSDLSGYIRGERTWPEHAI